MPSIAAVSLLAANTIFVLYFCISFTFLVATFTILIFSNAMCFTLTDESETAEVEETKVASPWHLISVQNYKDVTQMLVN